MISPLPMLGAILPVIQIKLVHGLCHESILYHSAGTGRDVWFLLKRYIREKSS